MEEYLEINLSRGYRLLKNVESLKKISVFDSEDIGEKINESDIFLSEQLKKLNNEVDNLTNGIKNIDEALITSSLIQLRVHAMNISADFDDFRENIESLVKAM